MSPFFILSILLAYFGLLILIAWYTSRGADTNDFFIAHKQSPWYLVAFGMIGSSISGVTFISVPGAVAKVQFSYFQMVLGYAVGYLVIGTVLLPLYYRLNLVSIYEYLLQRFGFWSYKTGAFFFLLSRTIGAGLRIFLAANVLQWAIFEAWNVPFWVTAIISIFLIWVYTFRGGIKTIVWTDSLQTLFLLSAVIASIYLIKNELNFSWWAMTSAVADSSYSQIFFWDNVQDSKYFWKQFFAGMFITIVMTGLDQDLMQKNLTCKNIGEAQKNMFWFTIILLIINLLFLTLGALLYMYATAKNITLPTQTDKLYPMLAFQHFGSVAGVAFLLGIIASTYASADSALASLTTSFCIDFLDANKKPEAQRKYLVRYTHIAFSVILIVSMLLFKFVQENYPQSNVLQLLFSAASYTYSPLLGLFAFGLFSRRQVRDSLVPLVCVVAPFVGYRLATNAPVLLNGYQFGFEILIVNGLLVYAGLWFVSYKKTQQKESNRTE
ncbi:MAG: sodium:solute symporter [Bacteroidetes bacterium]|nr:MAG: sodium:solute symporter [Bacteroidota bacterium]